MRTLSHYTNIPSILDMLLNKRIVLRSPLGWSDENDREIMVKYQDSLPDQRVFAFCAATGNETAHHWQVFADRGFGACIKFNPERLFSVLDANPSISHGAISYVQWKNIVGGMGDRLPFIKRSVFRFELEYRIIATVPKSDAFDSHYEIPIPLSCVTSVYLSGEIAKPLFDSLKNIISNIDGCRRLRVQHSGLLRNSNWSQSLKSL